MKFGSVCSGIEAASVAWNPLGWKAQWFAEIEPFPCSVLTHHYPDIPNLGDMTKFNDWPTDDKHAIDLLCGGTPCQSFSVAGLRKGLDDPRGNLMLTFGAIAAKYRPRWLVWENVPGVLSSNGGRDFGSFLGLLGILGYGFAYRILDAQYFGLAQRRRRVFVVGCLGDWRAAAAVLFERHSLQWNPAPSRQAWQAITPTIRAGAANGGAGHGARSGDSKDELIVPVAQTLRAQAQASHRADSETYIPTPHAAISPALKARDHKGASSDGDGDGDGAILVPMLTHSLRGEGFDASEDGTGRGTPLVPVQPYTLALRGREGAPSLEYRQDGTANALLTPNGGRGGIGVGAIAFDTTQITSAANYSNPQPGDPCHPLAAQAHVPAVAFSAQDNGRDVSFDVTPTMRKGGDGGGVQLATVQSMQVRRLTPTECERLQGFPDGYTAIPWRGKPAELCPDGPRYKALGNSWAVPNVRWIGRRIDLVNAIKKQEKEAA